jgi:predicted nucleotidyltransferase
MAVNRLPRDFREFLKLLHVTRVEYLLVGGYAVGYYGYPRATMDMDIWIAVHPDNAAKVTETMRRFGFPPESVPPEIFLRKGEMVRMGVAPVRLEILTELSGVAFRDCWRRRRLIRIDGVDVNLIGLTDLRRNKRASGRHKDLDDLSHLPHRLIRRT